MKKINNKNNSQALYILHTLHIQQIKLNYVTMEEKEEFFDATTCFFFSGLSWENCVHAAQNVQENGNHVLCHTVTYTHKHT